MLESYPLITTIVASVVFAFLFGLIANRLRLPTIIGYLFAGILLGPNTPGFIANVHIAEQLAEIGVILLMFGVGLHFSLGDLIKVQRIAIPGALIQMALTTGVCLAISMLMKHNFVESLVFGITLSVASTVVLLRALEQYSLTDSHVGKIAVGWLIVEDVVMIVVLVIMPVILDMMNSGLELEWKIIFEKIFLVALKITAFVICMVMIGKKALPRLLTMIAKTKSRELMSLGTLSIASGFAFVAYTLFGASFALGAFMAGFVLNESAIGEKFADKSLPLRDIFAVLFFVSAGMLFNPHVLTTEPWLVLIAFGLVVFGKAIIAYLIMRLFRQNFYNSLVLAISLAQIGEFSFILTALALKLGIFSQILYDMVIASAIFSITVNPFLFKFAKRFEVR
jgi:CPA2 family monovalent cation:H+ antiporter-2